MGFNPSVRPYTKRYSKGPIVPAPSQSVDIFNFVGAALLFGIVALAFYEVLK